MNRAALYRGITFPVTRAHGKRKIAAGNPRTMKVPNKSIEEAMAVSLSLAVLSAALGACRRFRRNRRWKGWRQHHPLRASVPSPRRFQLRRDAIRPEFQLH